jgi:hypothetical protein
MSKLTKPITELARAAARDGETVEQTITRVLLDATTRNLASVTWRRPERADRPEPRRTQPQRRAYHGRSALRMYGHCISVRECESLVLWLLSRAAGSMTPAQLTLRVREVCGSAINAIDLQPLSGGRPRIHDQIMQACSEASAAGMLVRIAHGMYVLADGARPKAEQVDVDALLAAVARRRSLLNRTEGAA